MSGLLGIGAFALRTRLPVSTLRYYDRIGLLVPADVDPDSGCRRYRPDQVAVAIRIAELRDVGVVPADIAGILAGGSQAAASLDALRRRTQREISDAQRRLRHVQSLVRGRPEPSLPVGWVVRTPQRVALLPFHAPFAQLSSAVMRQTARLRGLLRRAGVAPDGPWGAQFPAELGDPVSGFVFTPVQEEPLRDAGVVNTRVLPGTPAIQVEYVGPLSQLSRAYRAGFAALDDAGARPGAYVVEQYLGLDPTGCDPWVRVWIPCSRTATPGCPDGSAQPVRMP